jgi:cytochrome c-type biogenesis protein CcmH
MWYFYIVAAMIAASVLIKVLQPVLGRGRWKHGGAVTKADKRLAMSLAVLLPVFTLLVYLPLGRPDLPGSPRIFSDLSELNIEHANLLARRPMERLVESAGHDIGALMNLAQINLKQGRYDDAVKFYRRAAAAAADQGDMRYRIAVSVLGETLVMQANGTVTDEAKDVFGEVLKVHAANPIARYYMALYKAQHGDPAEALAEWRELLNDGMPTIYWKARLRKEMAKARAALATEK